MKKILPAVGFACLLALAALAAPPAAAQTEILKTNWELSKLQGKKRLPFVPVTELRVDPSDKLTGRLRTLVTLRNNSARNAEGLVLRYSLRLKLLKKDDPQEKAFWSVPYYVEEVRVTSVKAKAERVARIINFEVAGQLRKLRGSGFSATALKMEIMLCPRQGDDPATTMKETEIVILKRP